MNCVSISRYLMIFMLVLSSIIVGTGTAHETGLSLTVYSDGKVTHESEFHQEQISSDFEVIGGTEGIRLRFQGATNDPTDLWNPTKTINTDVIDKTVKGVRVLDLLKSVEIPEKAHNITFEADDGYAITLPIANILTPPKEQGDPILAYWYQDEGELPHDRGYQLFFNNQDGIFGNDDMGKSLPKEYQKIKKPDAAGISYPMASSLSVRGVIAIIIDKPVEETVSKAHALKEGTAIDPICGMTVNTDTDLKTEFKGETYYFCAPVCREEFLSDPDKYSSPDNKPLGHMKKAS